MSFTARYPGRCDNCGGRVEVGDEATYEDNEFIHAECAGKIIAPSDRQHPGNPAQTFIE